MQAYSPASRKPCIVRKVSCSRSWHRPPHLTQPVRRLCKNAHEKTPLHRKSRDTDQSKNYSGRRERLGPFVHYAFVGRSVVSVLRTLRHSQNSSHSTCFCAR